MSSCGICGDLNCIFASTNQIRSSLRHRSAIAKEFNYRQMSGTIWITIDRIEKAFYKVIIAYRSVCLAACLSGKKLFHNCVRNKVLKLDGILQIYLLIPQYVSQCNAFAHTVRTKCTWLRVKNRFGIL